MGETFSITIYIQCKLQYTINIDIYMYVTIYPFDYITCFAHRRKTCTCATLNVAVLYKLYHCQALIYHQYLTLHLRSTNPARTTPTDHEMPLYQHSQYQQYMIHYTCVVVIWWAIWYGRLPVTLEQPYWIMVQHSPNGSCSAKG